MRRARFLRAADRDLNEIAEWIAEQSGSRRPAAEFSTRLRQQCHTIASMPGTLGVARDDLGPGLRGFPWRHYLILFRYLDDRMQVVRILHGRRDLPAVMEPDSESPP